MQLLGPARCQCPVLLAALLNSSRTFYPIEGHSFPIAQHSHDFLQDAASFPALHGWTKPMGAGSALVTRVLLFVARRQSSARTCSLTRRLEKQMKHAQRSCVCGRPCYNWSNGGDSRIRDPRSSMIFEIMHCLLSIPFSRTIASAEVVSAIYSSR